jgi:hypothetical protein
MDGESGENAAAHPAEEAGCGGDGKRAKSGRFDRGAEALVGASAGWARSLVAPAYGLGAGRNAGFGARGLFAGLILRFAPMEHGFPGLWGFLGLGSGGGVVLVVTMKGPAGTRGGRNRTKRAESDCEASSQQEFLHCEHLNTTIFSIQIGGRLLYGRTVLRGGNRAGRLAMREQPRRAGIRFGETQELAPQIHSGRKRRA